MLTRPGVPEPMAKNGPRKYGDRLAKTAREGWLEHAAGFAPTKDGQSMLHTTIGPDKFAEKVASTWEPVLDDSGKRIGEIRELPSLYDQSDEYADKDWCPAVAPSRSWAGAKERDRPWRTSIAAIYDARSALRVH